jgi:hypothetical protein
VISKDCKRLAEVDFPIAVVSRHSAREKSIRHGQSKMIAATPNEKRTAEDRQDCYWLYVVTHCKRPEGPKLMQIANPAHLEWDEIRKIDHYALPVAQLRSA